VYFYGEQSIVSTESSAVSTDDQSFLDVVTSNIEIVPFFSYHVEQKYIFS
jgi:hypothetical protein